MTFELNYYENDDNDNNNNVYFIIKDSYYTPNANIDFIVNLKYLHILEWHLFPFQTKSMHYILQFKFSEDLSDETLSNKSYLRSWIVISLFAEISSYHWQVVFEISLLQ